MNMIVAFLISMILLIILRPLAIKFNLVDYPTERKNHRGNIPLLGGICIFFGLLISYLFFIEFHKFTTVLIVTASLILIHGVWDDFVNLKAKIKMAFQVFVSAIMIYATDVKLESLGVIFGSSYPLELGIFSIPVTIIAVIALTNAINMIDGLDGLAAGIIFLAITGLISFNLALDLSPLSNMLLAVASALLPFMVFNVAPYPRVKIFLGDGGSLFLGYVISWALIYSAEKINDFTHVYSLWCVAIPLFDFLTVIIIRIVKKQSLIIARKDHIHHSLEDLGFSQKSILLVILSFGLVILLIGFFMENNFPDLSFLVFLVLFFLYLFLRFYINFNKNIKRN